jgi:DNA sulfur modification protein DndD
MKISRIQIRNFGILHDIAIDFDSKDSNLVFLNASNGGGKTTFQSALAWCIYGQNPPPGKLLSRYALKKCRVGEQVKVSVLVELNPDMDGGVSTIERSQVFEKVDQRDGRQLSVAHVVVTSKSADVGAMTTVVPDAELWLKKFFPVRLQKFFLFDGEQMAKFWEQNVKLDIERAVKEIARVDLFEAVGNKMRDIEAQTIRKLSKLGGGKAERIAEELNDKKKLAKSVELELKQNKDESDDVKQNIETLSQLLKDVAGYERDATLLEELEVRIGNIERELNTAEREFNADLVKVGPFALLGKSFEELARQVERAKSEDWLPPPFEPERIQLLLDREKCICGADLQAGCEGVEQLNHVIDRYRVTSIAGKELDSTRSIANRVVGEVLSAWKILQERNKLIVRISDELKRERDSHQLLVEKLQGVDAVQVAHFAKQYEVCLEKRDALVAARTILMSQLENLSLAVQRLDKQLKEATRDNAQSIELRRLARACSLVAESSDQIYQSAVNQVRSQLQKAVSEKFSIVKNGSFETVITDEFEVLTLREGQKVELSEGEKMLKAYIFSMALRDVINLQFPLIVDTPFGRLGAKFRMQVASTLSELALKDKGVIERQMLLLMHDAEYTPYEKSYFSKAHPQEFYLSNDTESPTDRSIVGLGIDPIWMETGAWRDWADRRLHNE